MNGYGVMMFAGHVRKWRDSLIFLMGFQFSKLWSSPNVFFRVPPCQQKTVAEDD